MKAARARKVGAWARRSALLALVGALSLVWSQSGHSQSSCVIQRGLDPLDVLNTGIRHNVWVVVDTSGSMGNNFQGNKSRLDVAKDVLKNLMDDLVDASGKPLVNWGFVHFAKNSRNTNTECDDQFQNGCIGLDIDNLIEPPECGEASNVADIKDAIDDMKPTGWTPNGIAMDQISDEIERRGFVTSLLPNQKNFILMVTDGDDTCECGSFVWSPTPAPPFASSNAVPAQLRDDPIDPSSTKSASGNDDRRAVNAGTKGRLAYERLNPTAADRTAGAKGGAFVIGMSLSGNSQPRAHHLAWEASGAFYNNPGAHGDFFANNPDELERALRDVLARIGVPTSSVSLGASVVASVKELIPEANPAITTADIVGDVANGDFQDVKLARQIRAEHRNNILFTTSVETPGFRGHLKAWNVYRVQPDGTRTPDFGALNGGQPLWDAGERLKNRDPDDRSIFFTRQNDPTLRSFDLSEVTASDLGVGAGYLSNLDGTGAQTAADAVEIVVKVVRGYRLSVHPTTNTIYDPGGDLNFSKTDENGEPTWKLYDASNAAVAVALAPPRSPDGDPPEQHSTEYGTGDFPNGFYWENFNRQTVVYLGTNGGMIHAFRADNGAELYGFIPDDLLPRLKNFVELVVTDNNGVQNHQFFIAAAPTIEDAFLKTDNAWHTVLAFGRGIGGKFLTALDVTTIGDWDENPLNVSDRVLPSDPARQPKLLFNVGNRETVTDEYDGLGETWSLPKIGRLANDQWVMFAGGGYGCEGTDEGEWLYVLELEDGDVLKRFRVPNDDPAAAIDKNGLVATPTLFSPHDPITHPGDDFVTRVYIGDLQGFIYKLDTSDPDPANWTFNEFAALGPNQPITAPVAVLPDPQNARVYVFAGGGGDMRVKLAGAERFVFAGFVDDDPDGANTPGTPIQDPTTGQDFVVQLPQDERVLVAPVTAQTLDGNGVVFFATSRMELDVTSCTSEFFSSLFAFEAATGLANYDLDPTQAGTQSSVSGIEGKITGLYHRDEHLYVSRSGGIGVDPGTDVKGDDEFPRPEISTTSTVQILVDSFRVSPF